MGTVGAFVPGCLSCRVSLCAVLAGLVSVGAGAMRDGSCHLYLSGSGGHRAWPWQPGSMLELNKPPHLLFFPLKKMA